MKKIGNKNIEIAIFDPNNLNDVAESIFAWMDGLDKGQVQNIVNELKQHKCLNEKGLALLKEMDNILEEEFQKDKLLYNEKKPCRKCGQMVERNARTKVGR